MKKVEKFAIYIGLIASFITLLSAPKILKEFKLFFYENSSAKKEITFESIIESHTGIGSIEWLSSITAISHKSIIKEVQPHSFFDDSSKKFVKKFVQTIQYQLKLNIQLFEIENCEFLIYNGIPNRYYLVFESKKFIAIIIPINNETEIIEYLQSRFAKYDEQYDQLVIWRNPSTSKIIAHYSITESESAIIVGYDKWFDKLAERIQEISIKKQQQEEKQLQQQQQQ